MGSKTVTKCMVLHYPEDQVERAMIASFLDYFGLVHRPLHREKVYSGERLNGQISRYLLIASLITGNIGTVRFLPLAKNRDIITVQ